MSTTQKPDPPPATQLTGYTERPPQPSGVFLALLELHAAHSDDLTHQEESRPHQVAAAQVLETQTTGGDQTEPVLAARASSLVSHAGFSIFRERSGKLSVNEQRQLSSPSQISGGSFQSAAASWDSLTVNNAGRLLSFSISFGIPMLSQRTRKFSLHEFK